MAYGQASRFQILKVHAEGIESKDEKEKERGDGVEEMELAATNASSLEAWLYTLEVGGMFRDDTS